jgi:hypothetical protein
MVRAVIVGEPDGRRRSRRREVVIVHHDERALMTLAVAFSDGPYEVTVADPVDTLGRACHLVARRPASMIVALRGDELITEVRALLSISYRTSFLFLVPHMPPRAALARVVNAHGSSILSASEPTVIIVATLIGLMAQRSPVHPHLPYDTESENPS